MYDARWDALARGLRIYRQGFSRFEAACLPQQEDIYEFEKLRDWIHTEEEIPKNPDSALRLIKSMAKELNAWGAERKASILALNGLNQTSLKLATTVFSLSLPNFPSLVTLHEEQVFSWRGTEDLPTLDTTAQAAVLSLLDLLDLDPATTTRKALDDLGREFLCLNCPTELPKRQGRRKLQPEQRKPLTWRAAVSCGPFFLRIAASADQRYGAGQPPPGLVQSKTGGPRYSTMGTPGKGCNG